MSSTAHRNTDDGTPERGESRGGTGDPAAGPHAGEDVARHVDRHMDRSTGPYADQGAGRDRAAVRTERKNRGRRADRDSRNRRPPGRRDQRHVLHREAPTVLGLIPDDTAFAAMTEHGGLPYDDYAGYLREVDRFLRRLDSGGVHVRVTLFDPDAYADYCASTHQAADAPATRARYTAEATATGPGVRYTRQPLDDLRDELACEADRRATWEAATDLLLEAGACTRCGQELVHCAFDHASQILLRIVEILGPGAHHAVAGLPTGDGPHLTAAATLHAHEDGSVHFAEPEALVLCTVMAATAAVPHPGGLAVRTTAPDGAETVRGWSLRHGEPRPLTEAEVFDAYCTDPATGDPVPPEPGLHYAAGFPVPPEPAAD